ncbi:TraY domain-containing protein [Vibrio crassostreae]|uniref:TraY domain-containing protein n=1 Tax=Vibrio crassostreae TaxID=246167 RepID=UPI001FB24F23|nr:TraY domain-containing protein [Vibrio crassostreae]
MITRKSVSLLVFQQTRIKPANANKTLTLSAKRAERAKKREGKLRLEDHLKRFPNWSL